MALFILVLVGAYAAVGIVFALGFVTVGVGRVDAAARGAPVGFRLLILPGAALLWPVLLRRWWARARRSGAGAGGEAGGATTEGAS